MESLISNDKHNFLEPSVKIPDFKFKTLIYDNEMQDDWYKDPYVSCVFSTHDGRNFILYPKIIFSINVVEFCYSKECKEFEVKTKNNLLLEGYNNSITLIKHYLLDAEDYVISACEHNVLIWKYTPNESEFVVYKKINVNGGFIYNTILFNPDGKEFQLQNTSLIAVSSYENDFPIKIYNFEGNFVKDILYNGKGFYILPFYKENKTYLIVANWNSDLSLYDYKDNQFIMNIKLYGNLKNGFISKNAEADSYFTFLDWRGNLMEINLFTGKIIKEKKGISCTSPALCNFIDNSVIVIFGRKKLMEFINVDNFEIIKSFKNVHENKLLVNIWKFTLPSFGQIIITYGFDKTIKIFYE